MQIVHISDPTILENLDMRQKQTLVGRELAAWRTGAKRRSLTILSKFRRARFVADSVLTMAAADSLEMLLLLLWRHLAFYLEGKHVNNPDLRGPIAHTMRLASSPDVDTLRAETQRRLVPVLSALAALDLVSLVFVLSAVACADQQLVTNRARRHWGRNGGRTRATGRSWRVDWRTRRAWRRSKPTRGAAATHHKMGIEG